MTHPPAGGVPGIPGGSDWGAPGDRPPEPAPTFTTPTAPATATTAQFELAGWWARLGAHAIDQLIRTAIAVAIALAGFLLLADDPFSIPSGWAEPDADFPLPDTSAGEYNALWFVATVVGVYALLALIYAPVFMARWRGATPGKRALGIRVVNASGTDLSFGQAFLREPILKGLVVGVIGGTVFFVPLVSYLWPLWDRECRAGHDFMAKTRVVREHR